jgi:hypothetical protein
MPIDRIVKAVQRPTITKLVVLVAISGFMFAWIGVQNYVDAFNPYDKALGQLARAESAQTPDEVIGYVTIAKQVLPESGSVSWWSPERGDFESIQAELDDIINRAESISSLDEGNELFNSEMLDMHARLKVIQET